MYFQQPGGNSENLEEISKNLLATLKPLVYLKFKFTLERDKKTSTLKKREQNQQIWIKFPKNEWPPYNFFFNLLLC